MCTYSFNLMYTVSCCWAGGRPLFSVFVFLCVYMHSLSHTVFWLLDQFMELDSMRWFSHRRRTGRWHNCNTYLLTDVVAWPTATPATPAMLNMFSHHTLHARPPERTAAARTAPEKMPHFVVFSPWSPWPLTPKFELGRDFCTMHLTAKFHHPTFNCSEVIVFTSKLTNK